MLVLDEADMLMHMGFAQTLSVPSSFYVRDTLYARGHDQLLYASIYDVYVHVFTPLRLSDGFCMMPRCTCDHARYPCFVESSVCADGELYRWSHEELCMR